MWKNVKYVKIKSYQRKIKLAFMIYADFESILVPGGNGKQNPDNPYTSNSGNLLLTVMVID